MVVTLKELKIQPGRIVSAVENGTEVVVTVRGVPTAKIVPIRTLHHSDDIQTPAFGIWSDRDDMADVDGFIRSLREGRKL